MTDKARDEAAAERPARKAAIRKWGLVAAQTLVVLVILDGLVDLAYPPIRAVAVRVLPRLSGAAVRGPDRPQGWARYRQRDVPGLGIVVEPVAARGLNVDSLGRRATGNAPRVGSRGVLLGSSQAFGYLAADDATVAAAIERQRPNVTVATIAGPSRTVGESMAAWQLVAADIDAPDFGVLLFSNVELGNACLTPKKAPAQTAALISVTARVLRRFASESSVMCATPESRHAVVERALYEVKSALAYGQTQTPNFAVVIAPLIWGSDAGISKLRGTQNAAVAESLQLAVLEFRARLASEKIPGVIDLSAAFDGNEDRYYIDAKSHFGRAGADALAKEALRRLPPAFFDKAPAQPAGQAH